MSVNILKSRLAGNFNILDFSGQFGGNLSALPIEQNHLGTAAGGIADKADFFFFNNRQKSNSYRTAFLNIIAESTSQKNGFDPFDSYFHFLEQKDNPRINSSLCQLDLSDISLRQQNSWFI